MLFLRPLLMLIAFAMLETSSVRAENCHAYDSRITREYGDVIRESEGPMKSVLQEFQNLSKIFRGSGFEKEVRGYLISIAKTGKYPYSVDSGGNLTVNLPGTGEYASQTRSVALQSHIDMVLDAKDIAPGDATVAEMQKAIELVVTNGVLHSRGYKTTIGADNGIGVAMMMRYMRYPDIAHPPLTLYFTADEERGLIGAEKLVLQQNHSALLNLDTEDFACATIGCLGSSRVNAKYKISAQEAKVLDPKRKVVEISLDGFDGGHSGLQIHLGRANASIEMAKLLKAIENAGIDAHVVSLESGDLSPPVYNKIPKSGKMVLALPGDLSRLQNVIDKFAADLKTRYPNESGKLTTTELSSTESNTRVLTLPQLSKLIEAVSTLQNGVITRNADFTNGMDLSSNLAFFGIQNSGSNGFGISLGMMPRAFTNQPLREFVERIQKSFGALLPGGQSQIVAYSTPWTPDPSSPLLSRFKNIFSTQFPGIPLNVESTAGGIEPARFYAQQPNLHMLSFGPDIRDPHTYNESIDLASLEKSIRLLDAVLRDLGDRPL